MELQRIEYVRKNGRKKGRKKGVLWCGIDPNDESSVIMGFSLCHAVDRFDYPGGKREEGFGLNLAKIRAEKFRFHTECFVQKTYHEDDIDDAIEEGKRLHMYQNPDPKQIVEIPASILERLETFIERCKKYYKDKEFPVWVENIKSNKFLYMEG